MNNKKIDQVSTKLQSTEKQLEMEMKKNVVDQQYSYKEVRS